ncbi:MAG: hypothetical protein ACOC3V_01235 [bacterium]
MKYLKTYNELNEGLIDKMDGSVVENKKEERLKKQRKEEKIYLSQSERKRLNDLQKKSIIKKRKEKGSYNDEDFTNLHLF